MKISKWLGIAFGSLILLASISLIPIIHPNVAHAQQYAECVSAATAPACASAAYGIVAIAASAQTAVVQTTAVTANSPILLTYDYSLGTALGVTCNTTGQSLEVSARTAGTSFTVKALTGVFSTNPGCLSFHIIPQ